LTCKICGNPVTEPESETCGEPCRLKLQCQRIAWDRAAKMVGVNGYYDRRYQEHMRDNNKRGAKMIHKEWEANRARLGERP
jgi:uncharacterized short protein YbdD (DUF466 family)